MGKAATGYKVATELTKSCMKRLRDVSFNAGCTQKVAVRRILEDYLNRGDRADVLKIIKGGGK